MKTLFLPGQNGYAIPLVHTLTGKEEKVCLLTHGFGSSKDSPTARLALAQFPAWGIGVAALDLPAHGESPVSGHFLRIENCLNDLAAVEAWIIGICPQAEILYFSSSFGAYLNLIYLARRPHKGTHSFLRSAAVGMPQLFAGAHGAEGPGRKAHGPFVLDQGYERPILITAITTIIAMVPLAMGQGEYVSGLGAPFAITVIGGLTTSTLLTLVISPTL